MEELVPLLLLCLVTSGVLWGFIKVPWVNNSVARTLKKLRTSKEDNWNKQRFSSIASLFKIGTSLKGKNLL